MSATQPPAGGNTDSEDAALLSRRSLLKLGALFTVTGSATGGVLFGTSTEPVENAVFGYGGSRAPDTNAQREPADRRTDISTETEISTATPPSEQPATQQAPPAQSRATANTTPVTETPDQSRATANTTPVTEPSDQDHSGRTPDQVTTSEQPSQTPPTGAPRDAQGYGEYGYGGVEPAQ